MPPAPLPVNATVTGASPACGATLAAAESGPWTVMMSVLALAVAPLASVTIRLALLVPATEYVWLGFWLVEVAPSPKVQA